MDSITLQKYKDTYFGNYLEAVNYADYAFGIFIDELKDEGLYDDTVIFIFGDQILDLKNFMVPVILSINKINLFLDLYGRSR